MGVGGFNICRCSECITMQELCGSAWRQRMCVSLPNYVYSQLLFVGTTVPVVLSRPLTGICLMCCHACALTLSHCHNAAALG